MCDVTLVTLNDSVTLHKSLEEGVLLISPTLGLSINALITLTVFCILVHQEYNGTLRLPKVCMRPTVRIDSLTKVLAEGEC